MSERTAEPFEGVHGLADLVTLAAAERPDQLALVEAGGRSLTWAGLAEEVARVATGLSGQGVVAGHRVLIAVGNRIEFVATYLAVLRVQAVAVPADPHASAVDLGRMIADSGARLVVADAIAVAAVREAVGLVDAALRGELDLGRVDAALVPRAVHPRVVVVGAEALPDERPYDDLRAEAGTEVTPVHDPDRLAVLLYTSGASGRPRAAMLSHRALLANVEQVAALDPPLLHGDDVVLGVLPLFHVYGLGAVLGGALRQRAKLVLVERFDPTGTLDLVDDEACSVVPVAPPIVTHWLAQEALGERLGPVRLLLSGSAPLAADTVEELTRRTGIPVHQGYGLTEAAPVVTSTLCSADPRAGSVGAPLPGIELRLVDELGKSVVDGDPGEIEIRGPNLFSGYWPDGVDGPREDGWWATGDLGLLDDRGDLVLVDRRDEVVTVAGFPVYPAEVEDVVRSVPGVAEAAVIGVLDGAGGQSVVVYVVPDRDTDEPAVAALVAAVTDRCTAELAPFKRPARIEVLAELPRTFAGRVKKGRLRTIERRRTGRAGEVPAGEVPAGQVPAGQAQAGEEPA